MKSKLLILAGLSVLGFSAYAQSPKELHLKNTFKINSDGGWDYLTVNQKNNNLFVSHGNHVNVINRITGDSIASIANTLGVHGIAIANDVNKGYITNGKDASCTVFDLNTLKTLSKITVGQNPDATFYDDFSKKVIVFNGKSKDASVIDPLTDKVIATIALGGKPEAGVSDGKGNIYVNIEDTNEIVRVDAKNFKVVARYKLKDGEEPSGLAIDRSASRLFTVCANKMMIILNADNGKEIASVPIGEECDGVVFDNVLKTAYSSNGDGTISVVKASAPDRYVLVKTIKTLKGARTIALDEKTHHLFLPTADFEKETAAGKRPNKIPGTFKVLEIGY